MATSIDTLLFPLVLVIGLAIAYHAEPTEKTLLWGIFFAVYVYGSAILKVLEGISKHIKETEKLSN